MCGLCPRPAEVSTPCSSHPEPAWSGANVAGILGPAWIVWVNHETQEQPWSQIMGFCGPDPADGLCLWHPSTRHSLLSIWWGSNSHITPIDKAKFLWFKTNFHNFLKIFVVFTLLPPMFLNSDRIDRCQAFVLYLWRNRTAKGSKTCISVELWTRLLLRSFWTLGLWDWCYKCLAVFLI